MSAALGTLAAALVLVAALRWRPPAARLAALYPEPPRPRLRAEPGGQARAAVAAAARLLADRRARRRRQREVLATLAEAADLLSVAVQAGLTVHLALAEVAPRLPGPLGPELVSVVRATQTGVRLGDALDALAEREGDDVRPLAAALTASDRYGVPLAPALETLAAEQRAAARRRAEVAARRVPVQLLFPLVVCILPAFALLTVAPLLAGALRSLRL